jgi:hypothetical protein
MMILFNLMMYVLAIVGLTVVFAIVGGLLYWYNLTSYFNQNYWRCRWLHDLKLKATSDMSAFDTGTVYKKFLYCERCDLRFFETSCFYDEFKKISEESDR